MSNAYHIVVCARVVPDPLQTLAANAVRYLSVTPPKQQRHTRIVKDQTPDQIAAELRPWVEQE